MVMCFTEIPTTAVFSPLPACNFALTADKTAALFLIFLTRTVPRMHGGRKNARKRSAP